MDCGNAPIHVQRIILPWLWVASSGRDSGQAMDTVGAMNGWHFIPTPSGWEWHHVDGIGRLTKSGDLFKSFVDCVSDAKTRGYSSGIARDSAKRKRKARVST